MCMLIGKKTKKKFYAIKDGIGVSNIIVTTWNECSTCIRLQCSFKKFSY